MLSVLYNSRITPGSINLAQTIDVLIIAVIGGLYRLEGAWVGALTYALIDNYSREWVPEVGNVLGPARFNTLIGVLFLIIVLASPGGLDRHLGASAIACEGEDEEAAADHAATAAPTPVPPTTRTSSHEGREGMFRRTHVALVAALAAFAVVRLRMSTTTRARPATRAAATAAAQEGGTIKVGFLSDCEGAFGSFFEPTASGANLALIKYAGAKPAGEKPTRRRRPGAKIAGKNVEIVGYGCADDTADKAIEETRRLMEQEDADVMIGPLSGDEGIAVANYAKEHPDKTFVNGIAGAQDSTLKVQAPNFFRFHPDGAQWSAGLGDYAYNELGWKTAAIVGDDYSFPYTSLAGFVAEFCADRRPGHQARLGAAGRGGLLVLHLADPGRRRRPVRRHRRLGPDLASSSSTRSSGPRRHRAHAGQRLLGRPARAQGGRQVAGRRRHRGDDGGRLRHARGREVHRGPQGRATATRSPAPARRCSRTATTPA